MLLARDLMPAIRQRGMLPPLFQLETVEAGTSSSRATALVPPSAAMMWAADVMTGELRLS